MMQFSILLLRDENDKPIGVVDFELPGFDIVMLMRDLRETYPTEWALVDREAAFKYGSDFRPNGKLPRK